ncbi:MAG TPA: hypothetical protein VGE93_24175 [Bryobacteraceae bacterium]
MLLPNPASVLLRWDAERCRKLCGGNCLEGIRKRLAVRREPQDSSQAARLGALVRNIVGPLHPTDRGDANLLSRIEAHVRESGDLELQQLVKEYLAEV